MVDIDPPLMHVLEHVQQTCLLLQLHSVVEFKVDLRLPLIYLSCKPHHHHHHHHHHHSTENKTYEISIERSASGLWRINNEEASSSSTVPLIINSIINDTFASVLGAQTVTPKAFSDGLDIIAGLGFSILVKNSALYVQCNIKFKSDLDAKTSSLQIDTTALNGGNNTCAFFELACASSDNNPAEYQLYALGKKINDDDPTELAIQMFDSLKAFRVSNFAPPQLPRNIGNVVVVAPQLFLSG